MLRYRARAQTNGTSLIPFALDPKMILSSKASIVNKPAGIEAREDTSTNAMSRRNAALLLRHHLQKPHLAWNATINAPHTWRPTILTVRHGASTTLAPSAQIRSKRMVMVIFGSSRSVARAATIGRLSYLMMPVVCHAVNLPSVRVSNVKTERQRIWRARVSLATLGTISRKNAVTTLISYSS